jgi:hypothetical protein
MPPITRFAIPAIAAALALAVAAPVVADQAHARPVHGGFDRDEARLRAEIRELKGQLGNLQSAYAELSSGLDRIDRINARSRDRRTMVQIDRAIQSTLDRAAMYIEAAPAPTPPPPPPMLRSMNDRDFRALTDQIARASFGDDKLVVVQSAAQHHYFTVAQVIAMMKLASFDDTRVEIAVACAPRVIDRDKWFEVYGALSFSSSRDALRDRVGTR